MKNNIVELIQKRQTIYSFLRELYAKEATKKLLAEMPGKMKPLLAIAEMLPGEEESKAVKEFVQFADGLSAADMAALETKLAADYARLFLSIHKVPPHPSESVYREGAMMQYARDEVLKTYWSFGVDKKKEFTEPEDHIAVELSFLSDLCQKASQSLKKGNTDEAKRYVQGQRDFLEGHLMKWMPKLVKDILSTAQTPFYRGIAVFTQGYLAADLSATEELLEQIG